MKRTKIQLVLLCAIILCLSVVACSGESTGSTTPTPSHSSNGTGTAQPLSPVYTQEDTDDSYNESTATKVTLNGNSIAVNGNGAAANVSVLTINNAGTYIITGTLSNGSIVVDAGDGDTVRLVLNGANIANGNSAAIYERNAKKLIITLAQGSENTLTDAVSYSGQNADDEPDAALFAKDDLSINGTGTLTVNANYNNGIGTKDNLIIANGNIIVNAKADTIRGRDSITILDGTLTLTAGDDGMQSNNTDADKGYIVIAGGTFNIQAAHDGIQAESALTISGGTFTIATGSRSTISTAVASGDNSDSYKAIKATTDLFITGGAFDIDSEDDAVHSNGTVTITDGTFVIKTGDDAFHADNVLVIQKGTIGIQQSYEGLEAAMVYIHGGDISIISSDDGINAAGGNDGSGFRNGRDGFTQRGNYGINITGGNITIESNGDGLDSNGDINMSGGALYVHSTTGQGDGAIDYDGSFNLSGGTLVALGSSGMAQATSDTSTQIALQLYLNTSHPADTPVRLLDEAGNVLAEFTSLKQFQNVLISAPELTTGKAYTLKVGDTISVFITPQDILTRVDEDGNAVSGGGGPGGGGGGDRPGGGGNRPDGGNPPE